MESLAADFINDPDDDYNLIVEISFNGEDVAVIKQSENGLMLKWYSNKQEATIPVGWFLGLLLEAKGRLDPE